MLGFVFDFQLLPKKRSRLRRSRFHLQRSLHLKLQAKERRSPLQVNLRRFLRRAKSFPIKLLAQRHPRNLPHPRIKLQQSPRNQAQHLFQPHLRSPLVQFTSRGHSESPSPTSPFPRSSLNKRMQRASQAPPQESHHLQCLQLPPAIPLPDQHIHPLRHDLFLLCGPHPTTK